ncbi:MAG: aminopeptidase [Clostridium sp. SCN 57-10]|nr:MAG: aminopeptidase [Clostridium sp. SCN 57-10]
MKVFISADIEGIATTTTHEDCRPGIASYPYHCAQMTAEVAAACEGAIKAGATEIVIKDAHGPADNIDIKKLPKCTKVIRNWSGHPYSMCEGIDASFDAIMFVGYHGGASKSGNPLSHTVSGRPYQVRINGRVASEFMIFSFCAANEGVPTVFLSGDRQLCEDYRDMHPALVTAAVKDGFGGTTISMQPDAACDLIREQAEKALSQKLDGMCCKLPEHFRIEVEYHHHSNATKCSFYPGATRINETTIGFETHHYFDAARFFKFVL